MEKAATKHLNFLLSGTRFCILSYFQPAWHFGNTSFLCLYIYKMGDRMLSLPILIITGMQSY